MNKKTAKHLNLLRDLATPITRHDPKDCDGPDDALAYFRWLNCEDLSRVVSRVYETHDAAALAAEIRAAAKDRREALVHRPSNCHHKSGEICIRSYGYGGTIWAMSEAEIVAAFEADNARRLAEYEAYRLACEQGVAVPPM